jgi:hypothetical protein
LSFIYFCTFIIFNNCFANTITVASAYLPQMAYQWLLLNGPPTPLIRACISGMDGFAQF